MSFNMGLKNVGSPSPIRTMRTLMFRFDSAFLSNMTTQCFLVVIHLTTLGACENMSGVFNLNRITSFYHTWNYIFKLVTILKSWTYLQHTISNTENWLLVFWTCFNKKKQLMAVFVLYLIWNGAEQPKNMPMKCFNQRSYNSRWTINTKSEERKHQ